MGEAGAREFEVSFNVSGDDDWSRRDWILFEFAKAASAAAATALITEAIRLLFERTRHENEPEKKESP